MERLTAAARRPSVHGGVALKAQQPLAARGNQKGEEEDSDDAPELLEESDSDAVELFSGSSSVSSSGSPASASASVATPPSSPGSGGYACPEEADESAQQTPEAPETRDSMSDDSHDSSLEDPNNSTDNQDKQLRNDIAVLAAHLEQQQIELDRERSVSLSLQSQLRASHEAMERELENVLVENDALRHQNALLLSERNELTLRERAASEAHEETLRALQTQQQREAHARTIIAALVKERDALKKQVDESKQYCRRLEEDVVALRAEQQHLRAENQTLQTGITASAGQKKYSDLKTIREQERIIQSLRADVLQMEFEYKTVVLGKEKLSHCVATLQRQSESQSTSYDVICLRGDGDSKFKHGKKKRLSITSRGPAGDAGGGFTNLVTLPNRVDDGAAPVATSGSRPRTPAGSLVSKTLSSAKKKLFHSAAHATTVVLPQ